MRQKFVAFAQMAKARAGSPDSSDAERNVVGPQVRRIRRQQRLSQAKLVLRCQLAGFDISRESLAKVEGGWRVVSDSGSAPARRCARCAVRLLVSNDRRRRQNLCVLSASPERQGCKPGCCACGNS